MAPSIGMPLEMPFSTTVRMCSLTCKTRKGPNALGSTLMHMSEFLSMGTVSKIGRSTYTNVPIKILSNVRIFWSNRILYW